MIQPSETSKNYSLFLKQGRKDTFENISSKKWNELSGTVVFGKDTTN